MSEESQTSLLLDVMQGVGKIAGQNELIITEQGRAAQDRHETQMALAQIRHDLIDVKSKATAITDRVSVMEPDVSKMKAFRSQLALAVFFITTAVTGAINLIWLAVSNLSHIKDALREFMR